MARGPLPAFARRAALGAALALLLGPGAAAQSALRINGTGSGTGGMAVLAKAFMQANPDLRVEVQAAVGSSGGINALLSGHIELAVSNRLPSARELERAALVSVEYARTPFVVAVHQKLGITALTSAQLAGLYREGPQAFPNGQRARPVLRLESEIDTRMLMSFSPEVGVAVEAAGQRRGMLNANTDSEAAEFLERTPGAIAASTLALIESEQRPLVALVIDGKKPTVASLQDGSYPYYKPLYLIVGANPGPQTKQFAAFVRSAAGQALLRAHGHWPR